MAAVAALLSLCFGALTSCPSDAGPHCIAELARGEGHIRRIVVSHDGTLAAVVGESGLHVYTVSTGDALTVPDYNSTSDVAFSPDADRVAVTLWDTVAVVNLTDGTELWSQKRDCSTVAYSPDGTRVVSGHPVQGISIFNAATGDFELTIPVYSAYTLAYTPDGGKLLGGWTKGTVVTWKATTGVVLETLPEYTGGITTDIRVSPDGLYFATIFVFTTHTVNIYKLSDYTLHKRIPNLRGARDLSFSQDSSKLVVVGWGDMKVYSVETGGLLESHAMPSSLTSAVAYFHTSDTIITGEGNSNDSRILLWADLATLAPPTPAPATPAPPTPAPATAAPPTGAPPPALPAARVCTEDDTCRVFGDATANCKTSQHCACGTHSGPLCEIPVAGPAPIDVIMSVAITLRVPCDRAGLQDLLEALSAAATVRGARAVSVGASCGTLSVAVSGTVPGATIATTADTLVAALGAAAVAHSNLTRVTHASQLNPFAQTTQTSGRNTTPVCTQDALNTVQTYDGRCLVLSCKDGFAVSVDTRDGKDYHTCTTTAVDTPVPHPVSTPAPIPDAGDDGLSAGAIAGIVVGSAVAVAVLVAVLVWCVRRATASQQQQEQEMSYKNQPAGV